MKKRLLIIALVCFLAFIGILSYLAPSIFQRGNPAPYVSKMFLLNERNHFQKVFVDKDIYLTKRNDFSELQKYIEKTYNVKFDDQLGGGYYFGSDEAHILIISTIYWRYYSVWEVTYL